ncbi:MAG: L,D-transpeptidase family protein [Pseudomonadota bacterium]|nr:L,D-transpeptidase family protein [Pseudomonadota bacterium]
MRFFALSLLAAMPLSLTTYAQTSSKAPISAALGHLDQVSIAVWQQSSDLSTDHHLTTKIQTLLDRSNANAGPIDGQMGSNTRKAIRAFEQMQGLPMDGKMDAQVWQALQTVASAPILMRYTITNEDANQPFLNMPSDVADKAKMSSMAYESITEMLGEKFHMHVNYLRALNRNSSFSAGDQITVVDTGNPAQIVVDRIEASKSNEMLYTYDASDQLVAAYPATIGSSDTPSPSGSHSIAVVVPDPNYTWSSDGDAYILPPGPNNPVGSVWIGLSKDTYGIHGSPDPEGISRQSSHGCVRLTNWDALELMGNVKVGVSVSFVD